MAKNWQNSGFVENFFWTKFALFDERKIAFSAAKSFVMKNNLSRK